MYYAEEKVSKQHLKNPSINYNVSCKSGTFISLNLKVYLSDGNINCKYNLRNSNIEREIAALSFTHDITFYYIKFIPLVILFHVEHLMNK